MSTRCEEVTERLMELLYRELPADERVVLEAHIAGCERCRAEVDSFQKTRALARASLDAPVPSSVRQRLVAAAVLEAAARGAGAGQAAKAAAAPAAGGSDGGLWQKLRGRWTFPTLATLGAMALFLLTSRVFLNQDAMVERARRPVAQETPEPSAPAAAPAAAPAVTAPGAAAVPGGGPSTEPARSASDVGAAREKAGAPEAERRASRSRPHATTTSAPSMTERKEESAAPSAKLAEAQDKKVAAPAMGGASKPVVAAKGKGASPFPGLMDDLGHADGAGSGAGVARQRNAQPADSALNRLEGLRPSAPPPAAARGDSAATKGSLDDLLEGAVAERTKSARAPASAAPSPYASAPPPAAPASGSAPERLRAEPMSAQAAPRKAKRDMADNPLEAESDSAAAAPESVEVLIQRADHLFNEGRWSDAVAAYERLLRRYPKHAQAAGWRKRLSAARVALNAAEPTP